MSVLIIFIYVEELPISISSSYTLRLAGIFMIWQEKNMKQVLWRIFRFWRNGDTHEFVSECLMKCRLQLIWKQINPCARLLRKKLWKRGRKSRPSRLMWGRTFLRGGGVGGDVHSYTPAQEWTSPRPWDVTAWTCCLSFTIFFLIIGPGVGTSNWSVRVLKRTFC